VLPLGGRRHSTADWLSHPHIGKSGTGVVTATLARAEAAKQQAPAPFRPASACSVLTANMAFAMYPGLTHGAYEARSCVTVRTSRRTKYLPKMASGEWTGTMNLTEPHCGTDLGLMRTKAEPQATAAT
jgi:alkylation response protein AidB-like acyl-CoA dehydrogenase